MYVVLADILFHILYLSVFPVVSEQGQIISLNSMELVILTYKAPKVIRGIFNKVFWNLFGVLRIIRRVNVLITIHYPGFHSYSNDRDLSLPVCQRIQYNRLSCFRQYLPLQGFFGKVGAVRSKYIAIELWLNGCTAFLGTQLSYKH